MTRIRPALLPLLFAAAPLLADGLGGATPLAPRGRPYFIFAAVYGEAKWEAGNYDQIFAGGGVPLVVTENCAAGRYEFAGCSPRDRQTRYGLEWGYAFNELAEIFGRVGMSDYQLPPTTGSPTAGGRVPDTRFGYEPFATLGARATVWKRGRWSAGVAGSFTYQRNRKTVLPTAGPFDDPNYYGYGARARTGAQYESALALPLQAEFGPFHLYAGPFWSRGKLRVSYEDPRDGSVFFRYDLKSKAKTSLYGGISADFGDGLGLRAEIQDRAGTRLELGLVYKY